MKTKKNLLVAGLAALVMGVSMGCGSKMSDNKDDNLFAACTWIEGSGSESPSEMANVRLLQMPSEVTPTDLLTELVETYNAIQYLNAMQADQIANDRYYADTAYSPIAVAMKQTKIELNNSELRSMIEEWRNCLASCMERNQWDAFDPMMDRILPQIRDGYLAKYYNQVDPDVYREATNPNSYVANFGELEQCYRQEDGAARLRKALLEETSFEGRAVLGLYYTLACYAHPTNKDSIEMALGLIEKLLTAGQYSTILPELWRMWRCEMQMHISPSNDGDIANDHYESMRVRVAETILRHIAENSDDKVAQVIFQELAAYPFIFRQGTLMGNLATREEMQLLWGPTRSETSDNH